MTASPVPTSAAKVADGTGRPARFSRAWWAGQIPVPTLRAAGLVAGLAVVAALLPVRPGVWVWLGLAAAAVLVDHLRAVAPWAVEVSRDLPGVVTLGGDAEVSWQVRNPSPRPLRIHLADDLAPSLSASRRTATLTVPPRGRARARAALHPTRRGTFRPAHLTLRVTGPWGLAQRQATRELPGRIEVHPSFRSRRATELRLRRHRILEHGVRSVRGRGGGTEFEALREYVDGDEFRRIDWAATARMGRPVVRTYRAERNQGVLLLLDTGRVVAGRVEGVPRLDHLMDAGLALATAAIASGDRVGLLGFGAEVRTVVPPRHDPGQLHRLSTGMHDLEAQLAESGYREVFAQTLARFRRRALLVVLTELAAEAVQATLLPALPLVTREHAVVVVSVQDPTMESWRDAGGAGVGEAYRAAAAATLAGERERTAARLRAAGVRVVDAPAGEVAGRLVDAYLDVKAAGLL